MLRLILSIIVIYLLVIRCRSGHPGMKDLQGWAYAHRGLHSPGVPENSMAAFKAAVDHGYGVELDVHLMKDGNLAVIHDSLLNRTTGQPGRIEDLTTDELKDAMIQAIKEKDANLKGQMATQGTTPRQLTDLLGSLCDLTSGSGDKGTPFVYIQGYFDNYTD